MNKIGLIGFGIFLLVGCKSFTPITTSATIDSSLRPKIVQQQIEGNSLAFQTVQWRGQAQLSQNETRQRISITTRIKKDEAIWMNGAVIVPIGRLMITPNTVQFYEKIKRTYAQLDYQALEKLVGVPINYNMLENIFVAKPIDQRLLKRAKLTFTRNHYVWSVKKRGLTAVFEYDAAFRLVRQTFSRGTTRLEIQHADYVQQDKQWIPELLQLDYSEGDQTTSIQLHAKQLKLNDPISTPFTIPSGYSSIFDK